MRWESVSTPPKVIFGIVRQHIVVAGPIDHAELRFDRVAVPRIGGSQIDDEKVGSIVSAIIRSSSTLTTAGMGMASLDPAGNILDGDRFNLSAE
jgi:hypothetical protein